ncbi:7859_t:CDS:1 [Paraglomus brasilianum]|uniref:7859_t:CDS:1 n=1 Tax=Paraglomus brasilianum TaxID=144538 RepID=A0A9N9CK34_9GLOM|nr:7859_t:CDS:1 [Paraglomus brasilianum]
MFRYRFPIHKKCIVHTRCFQIRLFSATTTSSPFLRSSEKEHAQHAGNHYVQVPNRSLIEIEGNDSAKFLQGLVTNNMNTLQSGGDGFYTAFLNSLGRVLYDAFIYPKNINRTFPHPIYLIECDSAVLSSLETHLNKYKLRSKVTIKDVSSEYNIWNVWGDDVNNLWWRRLIPNPTANKITASELVLKEGIDEIGCRDRRYPGMGLRLVLSSEKKKPPLPSQFTQLHSEEYTIRRILHGVPEGIIDFPPGEALPLQSNFDYMDGIDFRKGCYLGQELTFRTYHTGVTRKRILPVQFYGSNDARPDRLSIDRTIENLNIHPGSVIYSSKDTKRKELGRTRVTICNAGLALFRLDALEKEDLIVTSGDSGGNGGKKDKEQVRKEDEFRVRPFLPDWWPKLEAQGE